MLSTPCGFSAQTGVPKGVRKGDDRAPWLKPSGKAVPPCGSTSHFVKKQASNLCLDPAAAVDATVQP